MPRYNLSDEQKKIIEDNADKRYADIAKLALCSAPAVTFHLHNERIRLGIKQRKRRGSHIVKEAVVEEKKIVRHPARYSNPDYSRVYSNL